MKTARIIFAVIIIIECYVLSLIEYINYHVSQIRPEDRYCLFDRSLKIVKIQKFLQYNHLIYVSSNINNIL